MARKLSRLLLINGAMILGTWVGFKLSDAFFWDNEIKYRIWEETERAFWKEKSKPKHIEPQTEFESVSEPGTMFQSYIQMQGIKDYDQLVDKYKM